ncbi:uncharacterized protein PGTG_06536 [Puccinia graminis f. sp. tritici CRL 75-36-700-3]|uniref:Hydrophobin n=1 Tax=Puccinia graminis f. sp. tritici (strain CRL 75-36-700-3 / race SCCL) TaxID=418459 RepID=E3K8B5_PUCGT|nr:uncharacterized protein PGTG_06536 [Puccinia graminis f. sp. tritici CRL 75-36-700-3]EFP80580.1 hypothetical protein PGTG_06536 [Puccinia graminis f. sp. tritici CRL 75-36-700-3]
MWAIKFFSILILIMLQGQAVYTHPRKSSTSQRSKDSTSSDNKPFSCPVADRAICVFLGTTGTSVQLARKNGLQYSCDNVPRKCCSDALKFDLVEYLKFLCTHPNPICIQKDYQLVKFIPDTCFRNTL